MKIQIVTCYDNNMKEMGDLTSLVTNEYCKLHGYNFLVGDFHNCNLKEVGWKKIEFLYNLIKTTEYEWIVWLDADSLVVNPTIKLESILPNDKSLAFSMDCCGICCGVFMLKNSPIAIQYLETMLFLGQMGDSHLTKFSSRNQFEQTTTKFIVNSFPNVEQHVEFLPESIVSNPRSGFHPNALIMHYWHNFGDRPKIKECITNFISNGWNEKSYLDSYTKK